MGKIRRVDFRIEAGGHPNLPIVTVLIDGEDVIGRSTGYQGFDPDDLLGPDSPLLPTDPPRRIAVYRCSCGEAGCGCAACFISERDGVVRWYDFRDFVGVYSAPTVGEDPAGGEEHALPNFAFDASQYRAAVESASADRGWETRQRRVARLLHDRLVANAQVFTERGYGIGWVWPESDRDAGFRVELRRPNGQVIVRTNAEPGLADEQAAARMAADLADHPEGWDVVDRNEWHAE